MVHGFKSRIQEAEAGIGVQYGLHKEFRTSWSYTHDIPSQTPKHKVTPVIK